MVNNTNPTQWIIRLVLVVIGLSILVIGAVLAVREWKKRNMTAKVKDTVESLKAKIAELQEKNKKA